MNVVAEVRSLIKQIDGVRDQVAEEHNQQYGPDYDYIEHIETQCQAYIDCFVESITNPTFACLIELRDHAKAHGYDVRKLEVELAHGQMIAEA